MSTGGPSLVLTIVAGRRRGRVAFAVRLAGCCCGDLGPRCGDRLGDGPRRRQRQAAGPISRSRDRLADAHEAVRPEPLVGPAARLTTQGPGAILGPRCNGPVV